MWALREQAVWGCPIVNDPWRVGRSSIFWIGLPIVRACTPGSVSKRVSGWGKDVAKGRSGERTSLREEREGEE